MSTTQGGSAAPQLMQPRAARFGRTKLRLAGLVRPVDRKDVLGEIDADVQNGHDFPFRVS